MQFLTPEHLSELLPAESAFPSPIPTQIVSSEEYLPAPQTAQQREVEARLKHLGSTLAKTQGVSRRRFFQTAAGMAAAYVVMNQVYGPLFEVSAAEASAGTGSRRSARQTVPSRAPSLPRTASVCSATTSTPSCCSAIASRRSRPTTSERGRDAATSGSDSFANRPRHADDHSHSTVAGGFEVMS
jgi:hypothetical protein